MRMASLMSRPHQFRARSFNSRSTPIDGNLCKESHGAVLTSGMEIPQKSSRIIVIAALAAAMGLPPCAAQNAAPPTILDRLNAMLAGGKSAWTPDQLAVMERLRDAAVNDPYALNQLRHLTDNIGPRISGSPQAQHAVEYVAAEMRALGAEAGGDIVRYCRDVVV